MESASLVTEVFNTLNVPESGKCGYNDSSISQVSLTALCKKLGLKECGESIAKVVSYAASIEILQHVAEIGSSLGNIDFSGKFVMPFSLYTVTFRYRPGTPAPNKGSGKTKGCV